MAFGEVYPLSIPGQIESEIDVISQRPVSSEVILPTNSAVVINTIPAIYQARRLTAEIYLKKGYITVDEIGLDGTINKESDPYIEASDYYIAANDQSEVAATTRKIRYDSEKGEESFPVWKYKSQFDPDKVELVESLGLENSVEISALAKKASKDTDGLAALRLYRALVQDALVPERDGQPREKVFLMALSPKLHGQLTTYFDGAIKRIGPNLDYPGEEVVPAIFQPLEGMVEVIDAAGRTDNPDAATHAFIADFILSDANKDIVHPEIVEALKRNDLQDTLAKYSANSENQVEPAEAESTSRKKLYRAALLGATLTALAFEQGPGNEAVRSALMFNVLDHTHNALAAGGAVGAITMAIEGGTSGLIALGLHEEKSAVKRVIQRFKRKSAPELDEDGKAIEIDRTFATKAGDLALALTVGPGIAMTKRHLQEAEPDFKTDVRRGLGYSAIGAGVSGGIGYLITGGIQQAAKVGLEAPAEFVARWGADARTWVGLLGVVYGGKAIKSVAGKLHHSSNQPTGELVEEQENE
jgi:hypothetical protein